MRLRPALMAHILAGYPQPAEQKYSDHVKINIWGMHASRISKSSPGLEKAFDTASDEEIKLFESGLHELRTNNFTNDSIVIYSISFALFLENNVPLDLLTDLKKMCLKYAKPDLKEGIPKLHVDRKVIARYTSKINSMQSQNESKARLRKTSSNYLIAAKRQPPISRLVELSGIN